MEYFNLLYQILAFAIMSTIEKLLSVASEVMWTIEDYEVFENVAKVRNFRKGHDKIPR